MGCLGGNGGGLRFDLWFSIKKNLEIYDILQDVEAVEGKVRQQY